MARKYGKKNIIKIDPLAYNLALIGESGVGKTTLAKEVCEKLVGEDGYLICNLGMEDGVSAIAGAIYEDVPEWDVFEEMVEDIIENKTTDYKSLKVLVLDTIDELFRIVEPEVIRLHNKENPDKKVKSIKQAFGGYMRGEDKAIELFLEKVAELKRVGVNVFIIGHTKRRTMTDPITGLEYDMITTNMSNRYFNAVKTKLHVLGVASIDREITREKTGKQVMVGKSKKDEIIGRIQSEARKITFRDDNFTIDSKSRFASITDSIEFNSEEFINAIEEAIKLEHEKQSSKKSIEETKKEQEKEQDKKIKEEVTKLKDAKELDNINIKIKNFVASNKKDVDKLTPLLTKTKELGLATPIDVTDINIARELVKVI